MSGDDDAEIQRLADRAERGYEPHQLRKRPDRPILHEESTGPLRWHTCAGCGKPWPCPDAPLTDREQDRLDEWRMDDNEEGR